MFAILKNNVQEAFIKLQQGGELFTVYLEKDILFNAYLSSFPEGERQEYNCKACRMFLNNYGNVVAILEGEIFTLWSFAENETFKALDQIVKNATIDGDFITSSQNGGINNNIQILKETSQVITWEHFYISIPPRYIYASDQIDTIKAQGRTRYEVVKRSLEIISTEALETVLELISQNSLYRGTDYKKSLESFYSHKKEYDKLFGDEKQDLFVWSSCKKIPPIKNTAIGTLLVDLSEGKDLDQAVQAFESKVAPENYKRPTALITPGMVRQAERKINDLGITDSLYRKHAQIDDLVVNQTLYTNRDVREQKGLMALLENEITLTQNFSKVEEIPLQRFIKQVLPTLGKVELLLEGKFQPNLMNMLTCKVKSSPLIFKWNNPLSWSYNGNVTDSIKEKVKKAGGKVEDVELRLSLFWENLDDLDISVTEPNGRLIHYNNKTPTYSSNGGLDIDMNVSNPIRGAVENIIFKDRKYMQEGLYHVYVHNYKKRESCDVGCKVELECRDVKLIYSVDRAIAQNELLLIASFNFSKEKGVTDTSSNYPVVDNAVSELWGLKTNIFHEVNIICYSPNFMEENESGNQHLFFMLPGLYNPEKTRGFYNEYLKDEFNENRKVFEVLGNKLLVDPDKPQLAGVGFSLTKRNDIILRVEGQSRRIIKVLI